MSHQHQLVPPHPYVVFFVFLMIRRPPRSTLFPTRRSSDLSSLRSSWRSPGDDEIASSTTTTSRSEEHTSELQSRSDLVCRLLLEKKNNAARLSPARAHARPGGRRLPRRHPGRGDLQRQLFFVRRRRPPTPPLFPYPTLFR